MSEIRYLTVTALTRYIKAKLEGDRHLKTIYLRGEISNFKLHSRGHMYFTLKDGNARISCVMFSTQNNKVLFKPTDGMKVLVTAEMGVYEVGGNYQLYVQEMLQDGVGNLHIAYEELKKRLNEEGLFSSMFKKELPVFPKKIGVITSPTGAAIRDILTTLERRFPIAEVILFPVLVQGENGAPSIVKAIEKANVLQCVDVLIVGRGGGSIEELWAFNEERVARAIFHSHIPIVSAVGHETDFTIADFVADLRAPTPTAAAELVTPHLNELKERIKQRQQRLSQSMMNLHKHASQQVYHLVHSYAFKYPHQLYRQKEQQLDRLVEQMQRLEKGYVSDKKAIIERLTLQLQKHHPKHELAFAKEHLIRLDKILLTNMQALIEGKRYQFKHLNGQLDALSPLKIMSRGYSLVYDEQDTLLKSIDDVKVGKEIKVGFINGQAKCKVTEIEEVKK